MASAPLSPQRAANQLVKLVDAVSAAHGEQRFPMNVEKLALGVAEVFKANDPIAKVQAAGISKFEGALVPIENKTKWVLLYNDTLKSRGRIRFTQAHELGHWVLHRVLRNEFRCTERDMLDWNPEEADLEGQADLFASYLLMPLNDFRQQVGDTVDLEMLSACSDRYGVSLTAAILKWLEFTDQSAVVIMSNDGFMDWAWSSERAHKAGAFFKTRGKAVPIPAGSLAADASISAEKKGRTVPMVTWFPHADAAAPLREMKIHAKHYDKILTLLSLPRYATAWPPWASTEE